jgi:hypothetical protein
MFLNLLHRPLTGEKNYLFALQQDIAHRLNLKVTLLVQYSSMFDEQVIEQVKTYSKEYGDEVGIWFDQLQCPDFDEKIDNMENSIWLYSKDDKERIFKMVIDRFREVFQRDPVSVGAYHMDAVSLNMLKEICPSIKISVCGCFEEGVKVFHGCNHSWYLFNEGMPWNPWYPSKTNSLRPAMDEEDAIGIVAVPHLSRDLALSYEGRNDFFASHPANVQRSMANEGLESPYTYNLIDQYRMQEDFNDGFSYCHVFVGANWLSGDKCVQDTDDVTQQLYVDFLEYFAELRSQGKLTDMYMSEFGEWYKKNIPIGKPEVYLAKELLYGSGKHYFWYIDPYIRVLIDTNLGGSIGDLRPYAAQLERSTGADSPYLMYGSHPYIIHSQYRSGISHHYADGARATLMVSYGQETIDIGTCRTKCASVSRDDEGTHVTLTPAEINFKSGLSLSIVTTYHFLKNGKIIIDREIADISDANAEIEITEYFKGCYGVTEYPEDMRGIILSANGDTEESIVYEYRNRKIKVANAKSVSAIIPQIQTEVVMEPGNEPCISGRAIEGYLFNPYFTLELKYKTKKGKKVGTCLQIRKKK